MALLEVLHVARWFGAGDKRVVALQDVSFEVGRGEFVCVVGPSGCGKTTLLKCLSGLMEPSSGTVSLDGKIITKPPREMTMVFQDYGRSLYPWLTVGENVEFPLKPLKMSKAERDLRVREATQSVGLADAMDRYPWQLSGGMQQRAALARAFAYGPEILLMDEPFASVDAQTRSDLEDLVLRLQADSGVTVVFVTHDIDGSIYLSNRVIVLAGPPTVVHEICPVNLGYPREQIATKSEPEFAELRGRIYHGIRAEATDASKL